MVTQISLYVVTKTSLSVVIQTSLSVENEPGEDGSDVVGTSER